MNNYDCMTTTLENITHMNGDQCTKFRAAVCALHGYNVQGVHYFDCTVANRVYRVYGCSDGFTVRVVEE